MYTSGIQKTNILHLLYFIPDARDVNHDND